MIFFVSVDVKLKAPATMTNSGEGHTTINNTTYIAC